MHWNTEQILWACVLAAHLALLIVLLGRDRAGRFRWFTAAIALSTVHLIADHLLHGKLTTIAFYWQSYTANILETVLGVLVLVELCRHVFSSGKAGKILKARGWLGGILITVLIALVATFFWGPWPSWQAMNADPKQLPLLLDVLIAIKGQLFLGVLTVEIGLVLRIFGRRFGYGWRSHDQQIALGLSTISLAFLAVQATTDIIKRTVHLTTRDQYEHIVRIFTNLDNGRFAIWFLALVWWIVWLWRDEPGAAPAAELVGVPVLSGPRPLDVRLAEPEPEDDRQ